jgi:ribosomal protein S17
MKLNKIGTGQYSVINRNIVAYVERDAMTKTYTVATDLPNTHTMAFKTLKQVQQYLRTLSH